MNRHSIITVKQRESPKGVTQAHPQIRDIFISKSKGQILLDDDCSSACPPLYIQTEALNSPIFERASPYLPQKLSPNLESNNPVSPEYLLQYPRSMVSQSSTFCTSLYLSSTKFSETNQQLGKLPFLPHPTTCHPPISAVHSSKSPLLLSGDFGNLCDDENSDDVMKGFLNFPGDVVSDGSFHGVNYPNDSLKFTEQLDLRFLSEELDIAITDNTNNPSLDEIYEAPPQVSTIPTAGLKCNQNPQSVVPPVDGQIHSSHPSPVAASHKPRMRWTPELHERFIEAVNKLDGAEKATPKAILRCMNVEGLTIYHVKSHLQKYRLAKYMPETKADKKASCSEEKKTTSTSNEHDARMKRGMQMEEALRLQMEVQKQLHEQLEIQRTLQLRIEEHARYLEKILKEQKKAGCTLISAHDISSTNPQPDSELQPVSPFACASAQQTESKTDSSTTAKHKATDCTESEQPVCQKRLRCEPIQEISNEPVVENPNQ